MRITEKKLIENLEKLECIKPDANWAFSAEQRIMASEAPARASFWAVFVARPAFSMALSAIAIVSAVGSSSLVLAQGALPGDFLYPLKKASQEIKMAFVPESEKPVAQLKLAQSRLEDLSRATKEEKNQGQKLAAGIVEAQKTLAAASQALKQAPESEKARLAGQIVGQMETIKTQQKSIEQSIKTDIINDVQKSSLAESTVEYYKLYLEKEIEKLENSSLTEAQFALLSGAKAALDSGEVEKALNIVVNEIPASNGDVDDKGNATTTETAEDPLNQTVPENSND